MKPGTWHIEEARTKFLELINCALESGPQMLMRDGEAIVTVVSTAEWDRATGDKLDPANAMPPKDSDFKLPQMKTFICG